MAPRQIVLPVFSPSTAGKLFQDDHGNPGCGGTQYVTVMLALRLAKASPDLSVRLVNETPIDVADAPPNLTQSICAVEQAAELFAGLSDDTILVVPTALNRKLPSGWHRAGPAKAVGWLHHPYMLDPALRRLNLAAYVSVGEAQYFTNAPFFPRHRHIPNLFINGTHPDPAPKLRDARDAPVFVHMSALAPAKGFHHVMDAWPRILDLYPKAHLHVIGLSATYGLTDRMHDIVPCPKAYGDRVMRHVDPALVARTVTFHGNLGSDKHAILTSADLALLNPTGKSEAFPSTPLECFDLGTPVIASAGFGMWDVMRHFPEAVVASPREIAEKACSILNTPELLTSLQSRGRAVSAFYARRSDDIVQAWMRLFREILEGRAQTETPFGHSSGIGRLAHFALQQKARLRYGRFRNWKR